MTDKSEEPYRAVSVWPQTRRKLRLISAISDKRIVALIDEWADEEIEKIKRAGHWPG